MPRSVEKEVYAYVHSVRAWWAGCIGFASDALPHAQLMDRGRGLLCCGLPQDTLGNQFLGLKIVLCRYRWGCVLQPLVMAARM